MRRTRISPRAVTVAAAVFIVAVPVVVVPAIAVPASAARTSTGAEAALLDDGDQDTYWQSSGDALPQWAQLDLGADKSIGEVVLKLPDDWSARTQTLSVLGSPDGISFATLAASAPHEFSPERENTVTITLPPTVTRHVRVEITGNSGSASAQLSELEVRPAEVSATNLAATFSASSAHGEYAAANVGDTNQGSYWESTNNAFPQWIQADLGASASATRVVLKLPPNWGARSQTLAVRGSTDGTNFTDLAAAKAYEFTPAQANTVTIDFTAVTTRYLRLHITGNSGWPAGQLSGFEIFGPATGDTQAPTAPSNLAFTEPGAGQIRLTWTAATDNVGVTGYDIYANNTLRTSVSGTALTYTDVQSAGTGVTYFVRAKDAAGNQSANSNSVTRTGTTDGENLALGKVITASSTVHSFVAANANDNNTATYWEGAGGSYPNLLTVALGANADVNAVVVKLNPDSSWGDRTQTIAVEGRDQAATGFTTLAAASAREFSPAAGNSVTIPVSGRVSDLRLRFTGNTGAPAGQAAEFQVLGAPAPNADLVVSGMSWTPATPVETDQVSLSATVRNSGSLASAATDVGLYLGADKVGTAQVGALAAGASATVSANIGQRDAATYAVGAKVDETNKVFEQNEANNSFSNPSSLVVSPVASSDLVASPVAWTPTNPSTGAPVNFSVAIKNQGTVASAGGAHGITLTVTDGNGSVVRTLTGTHTGAIAAGATTAPVNLGSWTAANGNFTVKTVIANDGNELPVKHPNNTSSQSLFVGRGANMPYDSIEAEDGTIAGGAALVGPNRTIGDLGGEASGRRAVTLNSTGSSVEFTTRASTNTLVTRFSIPDAPGGGGITATLNVYVNGVFHKPITLSSKNAWLYGNEAAPGNSPGAGPRHIYDEASMLLDSTVPAGSRIKLQKDAANTTNYAIDFVNFEQVAPQANPDPARYTTPAGFTHQDVQNALDRVRMDTTGALTGVYLPAGEYATSSKFQVYGKAVEVIGAGVWYSRFVAPANQENTDIGFRSEASANGSKFSRFAVFGNYTSRNDGPGKVFDFSGVSNMTIQDIWVEHQMCLLWGSNTDNTKIYDNRIRNLFADGLNYTNGSTGNHVRNNEARSTGDDSFALFAATDNNQGNQFGNVFENLTAILPWRAAGLAVYGGYDNTFRNLYFADTLTYSAVTISSLDFGYPMHGFGPQPTNFQNISIVRSGGHFWGNQTFGGIWVFSASKTFTGIRVSDVDIVDPTYSGIMFQTNYVGGQPQNTVQDTVFTNVSISGARRSGDAFDAKSGFGIWANEMPEPGQGPAAGSVTFNNLRLSNNFQDIKNTSPNFTIIRNP